ncbi:MAG TPA: ACT domain-containing protein [Candidatus Limnocylindrales bacterium]|nr:ACT domain-containing protein [Candidatus Limnocylindrales bacterium]
MAAMSQKKWFAMAAIGRDRPGIVADLSECVFQCGCNLEDASMTMLGSEFATLMLVSGGDEGLSERLYEATKRLEWERHLTVFLRPVEPPSPLSDKDVEYTLSAIGVDKAGIVAGVSRTLADHRVLIVDLRGEARPVAESGTPLYHLAIRMRVPESCSVQSLRTDLDRVASDLGIEVAIEQT